MMLGGETDTKHAYFVRVCGALDARVDDGRRDVGENGDVYLDHVHEKRGVLGAGVDDPEWHGVGAGRNYDDCAAFTCALTVVFAAGETRAHVAPNDR